MQMKKFHSIALAAIFACVSASSAQTLVKEMDDADTRFIPGQYMKNGEAAIYFSENEYGYSNGTQSYEARIFDFELKPLKNFSFPIFHPYTIYEERGTTGTQEKTRVFKDDRSGKLGEYDGVPSISDMNARKQAFIEIIYQDLCYTNPSVSHEALVNGARIDGNYVYISVPFETDRGWYQYPEYLKRVEAYLEPDGKWGYSQTYAMQVPVCNGEWQRRQWYDVPVSNFITPRCYDVANLNDWQGGVYLPFSQTFFNDDEKFEYVRYKAEVSEGPGNDDTVISDGSISAEEYLFGVTENDRDGDGEIDKKTTVFAIHYSGLEVADESGKLIYSFPIPENCEGKPTAIFYKSDDSILAQIEFNHRNDKGDYMRVIRFYRIDKSAGSAGKLIREESHLTARPNPATAGTPIFIQLPASSGSRTLRVNSLNGAMVMSMEIGSEETGISVPTDNLSPGMYIITLTENGHTAENCKIIIR